MIAKQYITCTGVYWNGDESQHETWVVNKSTGEKTCIGWMHDDEGIIIELGFHKSELLDGLQDNAE